MKYHSEAHASKTLAMSCGTIKVDEKGVVETDDAAVAERLQLIGFTAIGPLKEEKASEESKEESKPRFKRK